MDEILRQWENIKIVHFARLCCCVTVMNSATGLDDFLLLALSATLKQ